MGRLPDSVEQSVTSIQAVQLTVGSDSIRKMLAAIKLFPSIGPINEGCVPLLLMLVTRDLHREYGASFFVQRSDNFASR